MFSYIRSNDAAGGSFDSCLSTLVATSCWRWTKTGLCTCVWLALGITWVVNVGPCRSCPWLRAVTWFVLVTFLLQMWAAYKYFTSLFPEEEVELDDSPKVRPASTQEISSLPITHFCADTAQDPDAICAICLSDYSDGESLRRLPCGHEFHVECCDAWLQRNKRCPLCVQPIDAVQCK